MPDTPAEILAAALYRSHPEPDTFLSRHARQMADAGLQALADAGYRIVPPADPELADV